MGLPDADLLLEGLVDLVAVLVAVLVEVAVVAGALGGAARPAVLDCCRE